MTEREKPEPEPEAAVAAAPGPEATTTEPAPVPEPEPWTPERVLSWNRYYDLYVAAGVLLLAFVGAAHPISTTTIWPQLQTGRLVLRDGPRIADPFSYTVAPGTVWTNVPWTFEAASAWLYDTTRAAFAPPANALDVAQREWSERLAASALIVLSALLRTLTVLVLLQVRRRGPGLWWTAFCAAMALGVMVVPSFGYAESPWIVSLGGIAMPATVAPESWGLLLLAVELLLLFSAFDRGKPGRLLALPLLFALWANVDESFLMGLVVLAARVVGSFGERGAADDPERPRVGPVRALIVLAASAAACLANPWVLGAFGAALEPFGIWLDTPKGGQTIDQLSFFGTDSQGYFARKHPALGMVAPRWYMLYYFFVVGVGLASFALNRRRFRLGRFLAFAAVAAMWAGMVNLAAPLALVFATTLALNGQEWYLDRFGTEGRLGWNWSLWSVGGRALTLLVLFLAVGKGLTGFGATPADPVFGFGVAPSASGFEVAEYLKAAPIEGRVVNLMISDGDALIWAAYPRRQVFIDGRHHLYSEPIRVQLLELKSALRDDRADLWRPILDAYQATVVLVQPTEERRIYDTLRSSPEWIEFYDDGRNALFGRADARADDLAFFNEHRLDAEALAFARRQPVPTTERPPTPTGLFDRLFRKRALAPPQAHFLAAQRWLGVRAGTLSSGALPEPAYCLAAIRQCRAALAQDPDDPYSLQLLAQAYGFLRAQEARLYERAGQDPPASYIRLRFEQHVTALNFAVLATPYPLDEAARQDLAALQFQLAQVYLAGRQYDLALEHLEAARDLLPPGQFPDDAAESIDTLSDQLQEIQSRLTDADATGQVGPVQRADFAMQSGAPGMALGELEDVESAGINPATVKSRLLDLFCLTGRPDLAVRLLEDIDDPALYTGPGTSAYRQGLVSLLLGNYDNAVALWNDRALTQLRQAQAQRVIDAARQLLQGQLAPATAAAVNLPSQIGSEIDWEAQLGLALLEAGDPFAAADRFERVLNRIPDHPWRPLLAYYLEKIGRPVPASKSEAGAETPDELPDPPFVGPIESDSP